MNEAVRGYRVAFIISHPFQFSLFEPIAALIDKPIFVIETRETTPFTFDEAFVRSCPGTVITIDTKKLRDLDGIADIIMCLTPVPLMSLYVQSKVVCLQYSLSKELYQYGAWRALADLNLMFGSYSVERVSGFCTAVAVGNPRLDAYTGKRRRTGSEGAAAPAPYLLYLPTYGSLSSFALFEDYLKSREREIPVVIRPHHMSEFSDHEALEKLASYPAVDLRTAYEDSLGLIAGAAMVVSDFSGAAFDAAALGKPVISLQPDGIPDQSIERTSTTSLEVSAAEEMGPVVRSGLDLQEAVDTVLTKDVWKRRRAALTAQCFDNPGQAAQSVIDALDGLMAESFEPSFTTSQVAAVYRNYLPKMAAARRQARARAEQVALLEQQLLAANREMAKLKKLLKAPEKKPVKKPATKPVKKPPKQPTEQITTQPSSPAPAVMEELATGVQTPPSRPAPPTVKPKTPARGTAYTRIRKFIRTTRRYVGAE